MDDDNNIFDVLESPSSTSSSNDSRSKSSYNPSSSMRRSNLPLMNSGAGSYASSSTSPTTSNILPSQSDDEQQLRKKLRVLHGLGFTNPGPKNLVNVANVPSRRTKNRQPPTQQEKPSASKPLYDKDGLLVSDQSDRCDCNRFKCPGCFLPCSNCHSIKCGLECRNLRTYSYEYRLYEEVMLSRKSQSKKKSTGVTPNMVPLDSSLTSIEWLPNMQIGESSSTPPVSNNNNNPNQSVMTTKQSLPITNNIQHKIEATEIEMPTTTVQDNTHAKPPFSYVVLIRQAILSNRMQRMTLNEIYHWITETYPYFRNAPPKWKNSIRHNLSLNKCFKKLQRNTNDPGKGSYWALDESCDTINQINTRKRKLEDVQTTLPTISLSPTNSMQQNPSFYTTNNPMFGTGIDSLGPQSTSTDESDSTLSLANQPPLMQWDDFQLDLTASFRRFREQVLEGPQTGWTHTADNTTTSQTLNTSNWAHDLFTSVDNNSFIESIKLASSGEIDWNAVDVKPYCEFLDGFRMNSSFQQQDRDQLINLASSLSSFFDHTGITNRVQSRIATEQYPIIRPNIDSNRTVMEPLIQTTTLPTVLEDDAGFDWDSIT